MPGARPIAAAELAQPALETAAGEYKAAHPPAADTPQPQPTPGREPVVTLAQVRSVLARLSQAGHTEKVRELIQQAGADKLSTVGPSKYGWLMQQAEVIGGA